MMISVTFYERSTGSDLSQSQYVEGANNMLKQSTRLVWLVFLSGTLCFFTPSNVLARDFQGVSFSDQVFINQKPCRLTGIGVRKKLFLDIYYGALYLNEPTSDANQVINTDQPKRVLLHVVYKEVAQEKWVEGWEEGFSKNLPKPDPALKQNIDRFLKCFTEPVKKGEEVSFTYTPGIGTEVSIKGQLKQTIPTREFMTALWSIWFGKHPASESLMNGMLGK